MSLDFPVLTRSIKTLPVALTSDEFTDRAEGLALVCQDIQTEEARANDVKAQLKARLTQLEGRRAELSSIVSRKEEMRQVECEVRADFDNGEAIEFRTDNMRLLSRRPLTEKERQSHLPLEPEPAPGTLAEQVEAAAKAEEHQKYISDPNAPDPRD
jgi:hypothetical protein